MIEKSDRMLLVKAMASVIREYVAAGLVACADRITGIEKRLDNLPTVILPAKGEKGDPGPKGDSGLTVIGPEGPAGDRGEKGQDGKDATPVDVAAIVASIKLPEPKEPDAGLIKAMVAEEVARVISGITTPKDGSPGLPGKDGESIHRDTIALMVVEEVRKAVSDIPQPEQTPNLTQLISTLTGKNGKDGTDGRDALQIDILPAVDFTRSYPRGTWSRCDGGLIRSFRDTIPGDDLHKSGWEIILRGVAEIHPLQNTLPLNDPRAFTIRTRLTGGEIVDRSFIIPAMVYRGIYTSADEHFAGDVVTWDGSAWHCQVDGAKGVPGKSPDWKLMVKEGRKGKDGKDGEIGPRGLPGERAH